MRDGLPLPGLTPADLVAQLVYRVLGPLRPDRVRMVLDYHGLAGRPAVSLIGTAARHGVSPPTVSAQVRRVRDAGAVLPVSDSVAAQATAPTQPGGDHRGRVRIAATLRLPGPPSPRPPTAAARAPSVPAQHRAAAATATRVLATVGSLDIDTLLAAVDRSRRFRRRERLSSGELAAALAAADAVQTTDGRWQARPGVAVPTRHQAVVDAAGHRELTRRQMIRRQMIRALISAGYSATSAAGRMSSSHPLFQRVAPDRYRLVGGSASVPAAASDLPLGKTLA